MIIETIAGRFPLPQPLPPGEGSQFLPLEGEVRWGRNSTMLTKHEA